MSRFSSYLVSCGVRERTIDLILIDKQSVGKRSLHVIDIVNAK
jgi:hypothetical protein